MKIPEHKIEEVRAATDILTVVQGYVALKKRGQNWFGLCPWHAETQGSFSVHTGKQIFHCFSCGRGGNVFSFLMEMERVSFTEAVKMLAERAGIELPTMRGGSDEEESEGEQLVRANGLARDFFYKQLTAGRSPGAEEARNYLASRGYDTAVIERYLLGYAPDSWDELTKYARSTGIPSSIFLQAGLLKEGKEGRPYDAFRHRIMFPIRNLAGRVIAFGGRRLRDEAETAKYINSPETAVYRKGRELFGLWEARNEIRTREEAFLVEGYTDCLSLVMAGVVSTVASLGTALTDNQARLIKRFTDNVFILYDGDNAGLGAARRAIDVLLTAGASPKVIVLPPEEDPDTFVRKFGGEAVWKLRQSAMSPAEFQLMLAKRAGRSAAEAARRLVESAALIESPVDQDVFLRDAAERTGVSLDAMRRELDRTRTPARSDGKGVKSTEGNWPPQSVLTDLARTLIRRPELHSVVFANASSLKIDDPQLRELFKFMYEQWRRGDPQEMEPPALLDKFVEPPLRDFVSDALFQVGEGEADDERAQEADRQFVLDSLRNLEADKVREELADLKRRLAEAPDDLELLNQMQKLMKKEKELRGKRG